MAYTSIKQGLQRGLESTMEAEWQANLPAQALLLGSDDFRQRLAATKAAIAGAKPVT